MVERRCECRELAQESYQRPLSADELAWWCGMFGCSFCQSERVFCGGE